MSASMYDYIRTIVPEERLLFHEPMNRHTTFRVGGEAECMAVVETQDELSQLVSYLGRIEQEYFVLGNGSNLLVGDKGYRGIVVKLGPRLSAVRVEQDHIAAGAGALLSQVAFAARDAGLSGMEFAAGIPGSIGGGIVMNAGAYGGEMKQIVKMVRVMDKEGEILTLDNDTMEFGYRTSIIRNRPFIVLGVVLKLTPGNRDEISAKMLAAHSRGQRGIMRANLSWMRACGATVSAVRRCPRNTVVLSSIPAVHRRRISGK